MRKLSKEDEEIFKVLKERFKKSNRYVMYLDYSDIEQLIRMIDYLQSPENVCKNADNSCRQEKLECKGCYHNAKKKIIEVYCVEDDDGIDIEVERIVDNETSNSIMKKLVNMLAEICFEGE